MFNPANQTHFSLTLDGLRHDLQVLAFNGHEGISRPYRFELELVGERAGLDLETFLHRPAFLAFTPQGQGVHGLVYGAAQGDAGKRLTRYRLTLVPHLAYLAQRNNQRIFQHLTVPQIVALVLEEHGILADAYRFQLGTRYPEREYCVQYDESDLHFVQRLCAEEGIHFHFRHSAEAHLLVFGDDQTVFPRLGRPTAYVHDSGLVADEPVIKRFSLRLASRHGRRPGFPAAVREDPLLPRHRPAGRRRAARRRQRREARRQPGQRLLHPADPAQGAQRHARVPGGNLRPGGRRHHLQGRSRGPGHRQRHRVRPRRRPLDP
nr:type VI secretion system tip protein TssI/VgrG [Pseudomonas aeruginosa]